MIFGETGALIMTLTAVVSVAGNLLANMISTSRLTFSMAQQSLIPVNQAALGDPCAFATPSFHTSTGLFAGAMALSGSFVWLAILVYLLGLWFMPCVAVLKKRRRLCRGLPYRALRHKQLAADTSEKGLSWDATHPLLCKADKTFDTLCRTSGLRMVYCTVVNQRVAIFTG